jgi:adenine-specific DNA-methyltransferase
MLNAVAHGDRPKYIEPTPKYLNGALLDRVDIMRLDAGRRVNAEHRAEFGQFFTPAPVARFMAQLLDKTLPSLHLLDAGAGVGSLSAAVVTELCARENRPRELIVTAYEVDTVLTEYLAETLEACRIACCHADVSFRSQIVQADFIEAASGILSGGLFAPKTTLFDAAILNPPYRKIREDSAERRWLRSAGIETTNLYTAFIWLAARLLNSGGELVAITPRSFCNGPYFKPFRMALLEAMAFRRFHIFDSRTKAFQDDEVLQENIIFHAVKSLDKSIPVTISSNSGPDDQDTMQREVSHSQLVRSGDADVFINLVADEWGQRIAERMATFTASLTDLGIHVSTGRVVDFRAKNYLRAEPGNDTAPLIYPTHFQDGFVEWPKPNGKKPNALVIAPDTQTLFTPAGVYVLVKRFSSKEQKRRIVAAIYEPSRVHSVVVGFENHLNYYHCNGSGISSNLARGLSAFLNSTLVDAYFRQFNGHTQVNATDLRSLKYPDRTVLESLGRRISETFGNVFPTETELDSLIEAEILTMSNGTQAPDPVQSKKRIDEAIEVLRLLNVPRAQQNERSALTLLALLDLSPEKQWSEAQNPMRGITPMMDFFAQHYGKTYAPNTRETVRRQSVHQFMQAGLISYNPDDPVRPVNSGKTVYQVTTDALELLRSFGTSDWDANLKGYLASIVAVQARFTTERAMQRIAVSTPSGESISLSPGGQNLLIKLIIEDFCPRFTPNGKVLYVGDADEKWAFYDQTYLAELGVTVNEHGKMPDVVVHHIEKNWLILIEAVSSHGPVDVKRHIELKELFANSSVGLVFVTTFLDRVTMRKYLNDIAWETEVWVADAPDHLIHFNGERFLGPY